MPLRSRRARSLAAAISGWTVRAQHEIAAPAGQLERQPQPARAAAVDRQRLIAHFPAVAVRTVEHARRRSSSRKPGISGRLSTTPVAISSLRDWSAAPSASVTWNRESRHSAADDFDVAQLHGVVAAQLLARRSAGTRAARMPSRVRKPCIAREAALRGLPVSHTSTRRRQRPSISAALSPAGPAPMMMTSL